MWLSVDSGYFKLRVGEMLLFFMTVLLHSTYGKSDVAEYCWQTFNATCGPNEVIIMDSARYGRMRQGRCLTRDYHIGCSADVTSYADRKCSGRHTCAMDVPDTELHTMQPCPKDLMAYLEASYSCKPVATGHNPYCQGSKALELHSPFGYLSNLVTEKTGYGSVNCPWIIKVNKGQTINITLLDFNLPVPRKEKASTCQMYAVLHEEDRKDVTVCGGQTRERLVYSTSSNIVTVEMMDISGAESTGYFLMKYEASGCPDLAAPPHGYVKRHGDKIMVACNNTGETWHLVCSGTKWVGKVSNCSNTKAGFAEMMRGDLSIPYGLLIAIVIGVILGVIFGVTMLTLVMMYQRRKQRKEAAKLTLRDDTGPLSDDEAKHPAYIRTGSYGYAHVSELQHLKNEGDYTATLRGKGNTCTHLKGQRVQYPHTGQVVGPIPPRTDHSYESPSIKMHQSDGYNTRLEGPPFYHEFDAEAAARETLTYRPESNT